MTETYNTSGEPVDYQDRMARKMIQTTDWRFVGHTPEKAYAYGFLEGKKHAIEQMLEILDEENDLSKLVEETPLGCGLNDTLAKNIKNRILCF